MISPIPPAVTAWLESFAAAVRDRDQEAGRALFADDVQSFGTVADSCTSLDELAAQQWSLVWPATSGFAFDLSAAHAWPGGSTCTTAAPWSSTGTGPHGEPRERRGRATFVLADVDGRWLAVHSHFSMSPGVAA